MAHCCLAGIAASNLPEKYDELRAAYISVLDIDDLEPPPFAEFRGMRSICGNILCKWVLVLCCFLRYCVLRAMLFFGAFAWNVECAGRRDNDRQYFVAIGKVMWPVGYVLFRVGCANCAWS